MLTGTTRPRRFGRTHGSAGATAPSSARHSYVLGTMACSAGQLAEAEHHLSQALAQARRESGSRPLAALIARTLAEVYTRLGDGPQAEKELQWVQWQQTVHHLKRYFLPWLPIAAGFFLLYLACAATLPGKRPCTESCLRR